MIKTVLKETAVAVALFFLVSLVIDLSGETLAEKVTGALFFGVIYAALGVVIKLIRSRNQ